MKTYDIYAKQNGNWQRKGIQGEPTLPEYDGTVIIEKANSVLGLRRFKDTWQLPESGEVVFDFSTTFTENGTTITLMCDKIVGHLGNDRWGADINVIATSPIIPDATFPIQAPLATVGVNSAGEYTIEYTYESFRTINVINCDDVAEKWLLANTEGVSV